MPNDGKNRFQGLQMAADFDSTGGVGLHYFPFSGIQPARLEQNTVGNADFSNVVEVRSPVES